MSKPDKSNGARSASEIQAQIQALQAELEEKAKAEAKPAFDRAQTAWEAFVKARTEFETLAKQPFKPHVDVPADALKAVAAKLPTKDKPVSLADLRKACKLPGDVVLAGLHQLRKAGKAIQHKGAGRAGGPWSNP